MKAHAQEPMKKPYQKPTLKVYGDIRTMTNSTASSKHMSDGRTVFGKTLKTA